MYRSSCYNIDVFLKMSNQLRLSIHLMPILIVLLQIEFSVNNIDSYLLK